LTLLLSVSFGGPLKTTILEVMENKYWHEVPLEEPEEDDRCAMTLAKAKREEELLEECADES